MWIFYALGSAFFAACVAILAKLGLEKIDSTLATIVRSIIMAVFLVAVGFAFRKFNGFNVHSLSNREWALIALSGIAGALSWLCYFLALRSGTASKVTVIDRLSLVMVVILAAVFLGEKLKLSTVAGSLLMIAGALLVVLL